MKTFLMLAKSQCKIDFWATFEIQWGTQFSIFGNVYIKYRKYTLFVTFFTKKVF